MKHTDIPHEDTIIMTGEAMEAAIHRMAQEIISENEPIDALVLLGILRRGRPLADRIAAEIHRLTGYQAPVGSLATTLYRDDYRSGMGVVKSPKGETHFDFNVDDRTVLLVDDVLAAGRTIRAAMDEVMDYGRPRRIQLACLIDCGNRELPIQADYLGWQVGTTPRDWVSVHLHEIDGEDMVLVEERPAMETDIPPVDLDS